MKKLVILSLLIAIANSAHAQTADVKVWTRLAASSSYDFGYAVATDTSGNCIIAGGTQGSIAGGYAGRYDMFVGKFDPAGNRLWITQRGSAEREFAYGVATDAAGNIYVTGYTGASFDGNKYYGGWDIFVTKFGPTGNWLWTKQDGTANDDEGRAITTDASGNIYVTGYVRGAFHGNPRPGSADVFISKYDSDGTRLWSVVFGSTDIDESFGIACDSAANVFVTGWTGGSIEGNTYKSNGDNYLVKYDTNGQRQWLKQWGTWNKDTGYSLACDAAGNVYMSGYTTGPLYGLPLGNRDYFLAKFSAVGDLLWATQDGTSGHDQAWGVATDAEGNAYVAGETGGPLDGGPWAGGLDIFLTKYDPSGKRLWTSQSGSTENDWADGVAVTAEGAVLLGGTTYGSLDGIPNSGLNDAFAMKFVPSTQAPPLPPTDPVANPAVVCSGASTQLSATPGSGGDTVEWFTGSCGGTTVQGGATPTVSPSATTEYFVRTKDTASGSVSETCATVTVTVNASVAADFDHDCDVDLLDYDLFDDCATKASEAFLPGCEAKDLDGDTDVDQSDFGILQRCYSGENNRPDLTCMDG